MARRVTIGVRAAMWGAAGVLVLAAGSAAGVPSNDECGSAPVLSLDIPVESNNLDATTSLGLADGVLCRNPEPEFDSGTDVFYSFTPSTTGHYDFGTCGSSFDTVLSIHGGCPATAANVIACNDWSPLGGCPSGDQSSYLPGVPLTGGTTYTVRVASRGYFGYYPTGDFVLFVYEGAAKSVPANDECGNAQALTVGSTVSGSTIYATGTGECGDGGQDAWDVWYSFTSNAAAQSLFKFTVQPIAFEGTGATIGVYDTCGGTPRICQPYGQEFDTLGMTMNVLLNPNQSVLIRIAGQRGVQSDFSLMTENIGPALANWQCSGAQALTVDTPVQVDTTNTPNTKGLSCGDGRDFNGLWYSFTAPQAGWYYVETRDVLTGGPYELATRLGFFSACGGDELLCVYDAPDSYLLAGTAYQLAANQTIKIRTSVHILPGIGIPLQYGGGGGGYSLRDAHQRYTLEVSGLPNPAPVTNDTCVSAKAITLAPNVEYTEDVDLTLATDDNQEICVDPWNTIEEAKAGIWYTFTAAATGVVQYEADLPRFATGRVSLFTGACGSLVQTGCPGRDREWPVTAGTTYRLLMSVPSYLEIEYGTIMNVSLTLVPEACPADFNGDGARDVADLFAYINAWLAKTPNADFNKDSSVDVADLFAYINAWLAGC